MTSMVRFQNQLMRMKQYSRILENSQACHCSPLMAWSHCKSLWIEGTGTSPKCLQSVLQHCNSTYISQAWLDCLAKHLRNTPTANLQSHSPYCPHQGQYIKVASHLLLTCDLTLRSKVTPRSTGSFTDSSHLFCFCFVFRPGDPFHSPRSRKLIIEGTWYPL